MCSQPIHFHLSYVITGKELEHSHYRTLDDPSTQTTQGAPSRFANSFCCFFQLSFCPLSEQHKQDLFTLSSKYFLSPFFLTVWLHPHCPLPPFSKKISANPNRSCLPSPIKRHYQVSQSMSFLQPPPWSASAVSRVSIPKSLPPQSLITNRPRLFSKESISNARLPSLFNHSFVDIPRSWERLQALSA